MNTAAANQYNIAGTQAVVFAIHKITALSGYQQQQFAELMVVVIYLCSAGRLQVEQPEILQQVSPFFILCHT